jgi:hypothetical protein
VNRDEETRQTQKTPKGAEIPVPKREAVIRDLMKVAPRVKPDAEPSKAEDDSADEPDQSTR